MSGRLGWDEEHPKRHDEHFDATYDEAEDPGVTLVPQTPGQWAIALAVLALLVGGLGGVYWNSVSRQAAADEAISAAMARLTAASQSDNTPQSLGAALRDEMPMSGRYPVGPDGKLLKPIGTPVATPPDKPENMRFNTQEGAEAFTHYIIDTIEYMWQSGKAESLSSISDPNCEWCQEIVDLTRKRADDGGWILDGTLSIVETSPAIFHHDNGGFWDITLQLEQSNLVDYDGQVATHRPARRFGLRLLVKYDSEGWILIAGGKA